LNIKVGPHFYEIVFNSVPAVHLDHSKGIVELPVLDKEISRYTAVWGAALLAAREVYGLDLATVDATALGSIIVQLLQENKHLRWEDGG
jgi:hypothetical protein